MKSKRKNDTLVKLDRMQKRFFEEKEKKRKNDIVTKVQKMKILEQKRLQNKLKQSLSNRIRRRIKIVDSIISILVIINLTLAIYENNLNTFDVEDTTYKFINILKFIVLGIITVIEIFLIWRYYLELRLMRMNGEASKCDNIVTAELWKKFLIEFFILCIFAPPNCDIHITGYMLFGRYNYNSDSLILIFTFMKLYYLTKVFNHFSLWTSKKVSIIGREHQVSVETKFVLKAQLKQRPYLTLFLILIFAVAVLSCILRVFEYGYSTDEIIDNSKSTTEILVNTNNSTEVNNPKNLVKHNFENYLDNCWVILITMLTVGYGEMVPNTHFGRAVASIGAILGMLILSILVVTMSNIIELNRNENRAYKLMQKKEYKKKTVCLASNLILRIFETYILVTKSKNKSNNVK
jgi:hypothetical protein